MRKSIYIIVIILLSNCSTLKQSNILSKINKQVDKTNSAKLKTQFQDLKVLYPNKKGSVVIGTINKKTKKVSIKTDEYAESDKTVIYLNNRKPILIRKEKRTTHTTYLTNGDIENDNLYSKADFYVVDWQNSVFKKVVVAGFKEVNETINKAEIEEFLLLLQERIETLDKYSF
ncbi:hypothetical protein M4I21_05195 [Cellulophaga sp. 20_2_10]|uniref:hypothetical protein n=1 Tax=Cellulophaga sp. 20_2_10 TaxID=2942476 RepID=UPI00201AB507|nr:hypothetical protein [Cellulophaga sp. 20_2_10]MCL5245194.1 hypothetical protein [Cellulophaga sp. 20_2_10]